MSDIKPTGRCFCGCGSETPRGKFFVQTHDRTAEAAVIRERYGNIAAFVAHHGYGPDNPIPRKTD
jgi:hypothetical protein